MTPLDTQQPSWPEALRDAEAAVTGDDEPHMPLRAWIAEEDWRFLWRVLMNDIGVSREGDYPCCLTPWVSADA